MCNFKKLLLLMVVLLLTASCGGGGGNSYVPVPTPVTGNKWTVMVYLDADNNLVEESLLDLEEMKQVGSTDNVTVIVQHDTEGGPTMRYKVEKGSLTTLANLGELDMAQASTLRDFVSSTASAYPADHYALIIWNHGQGWKASGQSVNTKSIFTDVDNGTLVPLSNRLVKQALIDSGVALDILGIDACEMAVLEAAYEFRNVADILVSSQELVSSYGWDYDDLLGRLVKDPAMTPPELAQAMVASFKQYYVAGAYKDQTISALSLSSKYSSDGVGDITSVASSVNSMALDFMGRMTDSGTRAEILALLTSSRDTVQELDIIVQPATYIDLVDFARLAYGADSAVETAFNKILLAEYHGTSRPNAHGISIVFYDRTSIYDDYVYDTNYRDYNPSTGTGSLIEFLNQYNWDDMLHMYYGYQYPGKPN